MLAMLKYGRSFVVVFTNKFMAPVVAHMLSEYLRQDGAFKSKVRSCGGGAGVCLLSSFSLFLTSRGERFASVTGVMGV